LNLQLFIKRVSVTNDGIHTSTIIYSRQNSGAMAWGHALETEKKQKEEVHSIFFKKMGCHAIFYKK
jgi:hypothetical protein